MNANATIPEIKNSWQRCIEQYRLQPGLDLRAPCLTEPEIRQAREHLDDMLHLADPVLDRLRQLGQNSGYCVLVADSDGVVLRQYIDEETGSVLASNGLRVGTVWTEHLVGTNGLGTCLASGEALTVYEKEHFGRKLQRFSCSTAPLISPDGEVIGALDISTFANGNKDAQGLALNLVCDTAGQIEAVMFRHAFARHHLIALSPSPSADLSLSKALVAVNDSGWILGATSEALNLLGIPERSLLIGQAIERLTGMDLDSIHQYTDPSPGVRGFWFVLLRPAKTSAAVSQTTVIPDRGADRPVQRIDSPLYLAAGNDPQLLRNADVCHRVINRNISILLQGETGTGKEVWAKAMHDSSNRRDRPFVTLNCAAIPESLIESELFGYGAGTFTGGLRGGKTGKIEASSGGTLFLDEIGDMPLPLQARLLRVLAEQEITPLGQLTPVKLDLHVICATHRNLQEQVEQGDFRGDLYYRIGGVKVALPALRERQDKGGLIDRLLDELVEDDDVSINAQARQVLERYQWPGNIRQLKNTLEFALCMCERNTIRITDLPDDVFAAAEKGPISGLPEAGESPVPIARSIPERLVSLVGDERRLVEDPMAISVAVEAPTAVVNPAVSSDTGLNSAPANRTAELSEEAREKERIQTALESNRWVVSKAAEALGISRSTLHRKLRKYRI